MKIQYTNATPVEWRIDPDGLMRITMCILKEGVYEYGVDEVPPDPSLTGKDVVKELIPFSEFSKEEALSSLEGKPVVVQVHEWRDAENTLVDGLTVGSIAGKPFAKDDALYVDAVIYDKSTQRDIQEGKLVEVSAAYAGDIIVGGGEHKGEHFDASQSEFRFNHVLLLPEGKGRCGKDVRIINSRAEELMERNATLKVRFGNKDRTFRFVNEEDRAEAEGMLEEQKSFNAEELQQAIEERDQLKKQIEELSAQLAQHDANLKAARDELAKMLEPEAQEALAQEALAQREDEDAIIEDVVASDLENEDSSDIEKRTEEEKERFANSVRKGSFADRRKNIVAMVFKNQQRELPSSWSQDAIDGAFETLVWNARKRNEARKNQSKQTVLNGAMTPASGQSAASGSARERMLRPMRMMNGKEAK